MSPARPQRTAVCAALPDLPQPARSCPCARQSLPPRAKQNAQFRLPFRRGNHDNRRCFHQAFDGAFQRLSRLLLDARSVQKKNGSLGAHLPSLRKPGNWPEVKRLARILELVDIFPRQFGVRADNLDQMFSVHNASSIADWIAYSSTYLRPAVEQRL